MILFVIGGVLEIIHEAFYRIHSFLITNQSLLYNFTAERAHKWNVLRETPHPVDYEVQKNLDNLLRNQTLKLDLFLF